MEVQFIEPCCASRQLPALLREQNFAAFQTNGDVTFEHIIKAVSFLAGDEITVQVMLPSIDVDMLRVLAWFGRRGWLKRLQVLTHDNQLDLVSNEVSGEIPSVSCYHNERVVESLLVISGEKGCVAVTGRLLSANEPGHRFYTAAVGRSDSDGVRMITATMGQLMRNEDKTPSVDMSPQVEETSDVTTEEPAKNKSKRKR